MIEDCSFGDHMSTVWGQLQCIVCPYLLIT